MLLMRFSQLQSLEIFNGLINLQWFRCSHAAAGALLLLPLSLAGCGNSGIPLLTGEQLSVQPASEQWTLVNYWATWCAPCRDEIPELNHLNKDASIRVIGVNFDQLEGEPLKNAVQEMNIEFAVALQDPRTLWHYEMPQALPATVLISPAGKVTATLLGPQTEESLRQRIAK